MNTLRCFRNALASFALAACLILPAEAEPALWVIHGSGSTIYLFGTVHALKPGTVWLTPKISRAFAVSQDLWLEVADLDAADNQGLMLQLGMDPAHPLSRQLIPADVVRLERASKIAGFSDLSQLDPMKPWFAALALSAAPVLRAGYDPNSGVDRTLQTKAIAAGKPIKGFETAGQQLHFLADLPQGQQLDFLRQALDDVDEDPAKLSSLIDGWAQGDVAAIAKMENDDLRVQSPSLYRKLIIDRNLAWAKGLAAMAHEPGTHFVAVGSAHLAGPDSVQNALTPYGIVAQQE